MMTAQLPVMRRVLAALLLALPLLAAALPAAAQCPAAPVQALSLPRTRAALVSGAPLRILAFGSSSTEGTGATWPDRTYPEQLEQRLRAALPGRNVIVLNRGRGGQEVAEMLLRLRADVLALSPTLVIWQVGANAALRGLDAREFRAKLEQGLDELRASGIETLLMDSQVAPQIQAAPERLHIQTALHAVAAERRVPIYSRTALMQGWEAHGMPNSAVIGPDGLHHTDLGYACLSAALAQSILAAIQPSRASASR
ncbi:SGNH/GDSL hydrolase family protein [Plastoroseomonas arctica]|uniref:SGNH/GDSL hydrolase family protein n=1 Tax=Plastoroseomonas arctica TaxID=1509237 RepID=A0AAF1KPF9_9PROT|nr:SGNH/GDSL hydrolase family protein [Plastoroseomonas arctica]MBR0657479.1 SGNH/GDSL hydrolase family protein [Plastoroseomonas arctica]